MRQPLQRAATMACRSATKFRFAYGWSEGAVRGGPNKCYQLEHKCLGDLIPFSSMAIKGGGDVSSRIMLTGVTSPLFWELDRNQEACALFTALKLCCSNLFPWLCLSFPTEKNQTNNRMKRILRKTLWNLFYPNYNHVIPNPMARVGWCADFSMFLTFSHPKRQSCDFFPEGISRKHCFLKESKENTLAWDCFPLGRLCQPHTPCTWN